MCGSGVEGKGSKFYTETGVEPEARGPTALGNEMQMIPNVQKVRNLEPEGTMTMLALRNCSCLEKNLGLPMEWALETIPFELQRK